MKRSLLLVFIAFFLFGSVASAATLRLHIPVSSSWSGESLNSGESISSSGYSLRGIFGLIGAGYTSSTLKYTSSGSSSKFTSNAIDVSVTPIDLLTVGYGMVMSGDIVFDCCPNAELDSASGSTMFFNLNFGLGPVDLLLGYRTWDAKHKAKFSNGATSESELKYAEIGAGVGFGF